MVSVNTDTALTCLCQTDVHNITYTLHNIKHVSYPPPQLCETSFVVRHLWSIGPPQADVTLAVSTRLFEYNQH